MVKKRLIFLHIVSVSSSDVFSIPPLLAPLDGFFLVQDGGGGLEICCLVEICNSGGMN